MLMNHRGATQYIALSLGKSLKYITHLFGIIKSVAHIISSYKVRIKTRGNEGMAIKFHPIYQVNVWTKTR